MVTTYDIAKKTGLNQSTVSRVLSGSTRINPATAEKVYRACRELNYVPNRSARALKTKRSNTIAIHIPFGSETVLADPFIPAFLSGVSQEAARQGYSVILSYPNQTDMKDELSAMVKSGQADGVIVTSPSLSDPWVKSLVKAGVPFVIGRYEGKPGARMACVDIDNRHSGYQAGKFLLSRGYRKIGLITEEKEHIGARDFQEGFLQAMAEWKIRQSGRLINPASVTFEAAYQAAKEMIELKEPPGAIIANTALTVFGALEAVRKAGKKILVLGVESPLLRSMYPDMPRICSPVEELGREMAGALIGLLHSPDEHPDCKMLYTKIVDEKGEVFMEEPI